MGKGKKDAKPTSGMMWRNQAAQARRGYVITLPSGNNAKIGSVDLAAMLQAGDVPDMLTPVAAKAIWVEMSYDQLGEATTETTINTLKLVNMICTAAFIQPRIVDEPTEEDEIGIQDVGLDDRLAVFTLAIQPTTVLQKFCEQQSPDMDAVLNGQNVRATAVANDDNS